MGMGEALVKLPNQSNLNDENIEENTSNDEENTLCWSIIEAEKNKKEIPDMVVTEASSDSTYPMECNFEKEEGQEDVIAQEKLRPERA